SFSSPLLAPCGADGLDRRSLAGFRTRGFANVYFFVPLLLLVLPLLLLVPLFAVPLFVVPLVPPELPELEDSSICLRRSRSSSRRSWISRRRAASSLPESLQLHECVPLGAW